MIGGQFALKRLGFNILEDNSDGLAKRAAGVTNVDVGLFFHKDWLLSAVSEPRFKVSDLHSNKQHGFLMSVDVVIGAKLGNDGAKKHITVTA